MYDVNNDLSTIVVDASIQDKWEAGAEVLLTSATSQWDDHQVRRIAAVAPYALIQEQKLVSISLDAPLAYRPTTIQDSADFAVEVALLSRNIVFTGGYDENAAHGAHLWVIRTPWVQQMIEGVEFVNFGQQGLLGRCVPSPNAGGFSLSFNCFIDTEQSLLFFVVQISYSFPLLRRRSRFSSFKERDPAIASTLRSCSRDKQAAYRKERCL